MSNMNEVWKDIKGYEGFYQVSNLGRVRSVDRLVHTEANGIKIRLSKGKILNAGKKDWYRTVGLSKYGVRKSFTVHRLVAEAFLPNPYNYPVVNHKDENKTNNFVFVNQDGSIDPEKSNIEWCTQKHNMNWNSVIKRKVGPKLRKSEEEKRLNRKKYNEAHKEEYKKYFHEWYLKNRVLKGTDNKKAVFQYTKNGVFVAEYVSIADAVEKTGISHIGCAASGKRKSAGGYIWKFA